MDNAITLQSKLSSVQSFVALKTSIQNRATPACITGLSLVHKAFYVAGLLEEQTAPALLLCGDEAECAKLTEDLTALGLSANFYPAKDLCLRDVETVSREYEHQRLAVLCHLLSHSCDCVVATVDAALQYTIPPAMLQQHTITLKQETDIPMETVLTLLVQNGYVRAEQIDGTGQFSVRGGILDFFPPESSLPYRVEFWGDTIDTISTFDLTTQRRLDSITAVTLSPSREVLVADDVALAEVLREHASTLRGKYAPKQKEHLLALAEKLEQHLPLACTDAFLSFLYTPATLLGYFPDQSLLCFSEESKLKERLRTTTWQWNEDCVALLEEGVLSHGLTAFSADKDLLFAMAKTHPTLLLETFARGSSDFPLKTLLHANVRQLSPWGGAVSLLVEDLENYLATNTACVVLAGVEKAARSLAEDLQERGLPAHYVTNCAELPRGQITVLSGALSGGMEFPEDHLVILTYRQQAVSKPAKRQKKNPNSQTLYSLSDLSVGDYVVHTIHGVGQYQGIHKIAMQGITKDYLKVQYAKQDILYVPVTQLDLVAKYIGPREDSLVKLNRLGTQEWQKAKTKVRAAVKDIAKELIALYAKRQQAKGHAFPEDTDYQKDFEAHFAYEETTDQLRCIGEIKADMESSMPMDRLLCGDVGFGKTEVALRAAFKCVSDSMQCAILVPTTILAWQHYQTLCQRMEPFPVKIGLLSRFRTAKQQAETIRQLKSGELDIVVGTHRLVSKDVTFRRLGLVVIDEEQRFGVAQKERLKSLKENVDILTLSATPIPRTLNMALSGIRDMSILEEAPGDRHPVQTYVLEYDKGVVCDAIRKELRRGGQVFYLHNNVDSIERIAMGLQESIPEARIGIGHGKMTEQQLSAVWRQMLEQEIDILVCTTIIETGIDIPNANTLIIDNADRMGLSQLHQIRGRVGRSSRRAYAYFTFQRGKALTEIAQKRLTAIRDFTAFGSGFQIAMRDLELRGAGNLLGGQQHGHMESVGYELYLKLLGEAVATEKGLPVETAEGECVVDVQMEAHIPEWYIESLTQRLELYRRIADIRSEEDALDVTDELLDRFGKLPESVHGLIDVALLRNRASALGILEIKQRGDTLLLYPKVLDLKQVEKLTAVLHGRVTVKSGKQSFLQVRMRKDATPLEALSEMLSILAK